jgi:hypothetical protein
MDPAAFADEVKMTYEDAADLMVKSEHGVAASGFAKTPVGLALTASWPPKRESMSFQAASRQARCYPNSKADCARTQIIPPPPLLARLLFALRVLRFSPSRGRGRPRPEATSHIIAYWEAFLPIWALQT